MSITREQFLSGAIFQLKGFEYARFQFIKNADDREPGYLRELNGTRFQFSEHHANVERVTKTGFKAYTILVSRSIRRWCRFEDMELVEDQYSENSEKKVS